MPEELLRYKLFPKRMQMKDNGESEDRGKLPKISQIVDAFNRNEDYRQMPNLLLMEVEDSGNTYVIGGYSSHGWAPRVVGDDSSFIFNLTNNLRFNAIAKQRAQYEFFTKVVDLDEGEDSDVDIDQGRGNNKPVHIPNWQLNFGEAELLISEDFLRIKSDLQNGAHFALSGDAFNKGKVRSIIPHLKHFVASRVEVWAFDEFINLLEEEETFVNEGENQDQESVSPDAMYGEEHRGPQDDSENTSSFNSSLSQSNTMSQGSANFA